VLEVSYKTITSTALLHPASIHFAILTRAQDRTTHCTFGKLKWAIEYTFHRLHDVYEMTTDCVCMCAAAPSQTCDMMKRQDVSGHGSFHHSTLMLRPCACSPERAAVTTQWTASGRQTLEILFVVSTRGKKKRNEDVRVVEN